MSGTPPPNYNPNDSLLSGGDSAKIIPVQGGGSLSGMPNSYNPDASLLSGGETAKIMPVQGGGNPHESKSNDDGNNGASTLTGEEEESKGDEEEENNNGASALTGEEEESKGDEPNEEATVSETGATEGEDESETPTKEIPCPEPDSKNLEDLSDEFVESEEAKETKLTETISLSAKEFVLRKPKSKKPGSEEKDEVMSDWTSLVFTKSEADFLNTLGLSPKLLFSTFHCLDKEWEEELAEFMYYLTVLTCYPARFVITKGQCQRVREFLELVESTIKVQKLRKLAETPIPVVGPITLSDLGEEEEEGEEEGEEGENQGNNSHAEVFDRLKGITVEESKEKKSFTKKVRSFLSKLKFPSLFKKMKEEQENGNFPNEVGENENVDDDGNIVQNNNGDDGDENEENKEKHDKDLEKEYLELLREAEIKKALDGLPKEYQTETYRQYINRELRKHGFKEGNFANE
jgi:hypothetical protein